VQINTKDRVQQGVIIMIDVYSVFETSMRKEIDAVVAVIDANGTSFCSPKTEWIEVADYFALG
jgi:hypothetical protein